MQRSRIQRTGKADKDKFFVVLMMHKRQKRKVDGVRTDERAQMQEEWKRKSGGKGEEKEKAVQR
jgi:hypothetical protein